MGPKSKVSKANFFQNQSNPQPDAWYIPKSEFHQGLEAAYGPCSRFLFLPDTNEDTHEDHLSFKNHVSSKKLEFVFSNGFYNTAICEDDEFPSLKRVLGEGIVRLYINKETAIDDAEDVGFVFVIDARKENNLTCIATSPVNMGSTDANIDNDFRQEYADCHGSTVSEGEEGSDIWMFVGAQQIDFKQIVGAYVTGALAHELSINTDTMLIVNPNYEGNLDEVKQQLKLDKLIRTIPSFHFTSDIVREIINTFYHQQSESTTLSMG